MMLEDIITILEDKEYTDEYLYKKYGLTEEEIEFIESKFK